MALVEALDPVQEPDAQDPLVALVTAYTIADVALVGAFLEAAGIDHFANSEILSILHPVHGPAKMMVRESDLEAAVAALWALDPRFTQEWESRFPRPVNPASD